MSPQELTQAIKQKASELGFDLCGVAPADIGKNDFDFFSRWVSKGYHASMQWLEKNPHKRSHPSNVLENAKSIISVGLNYYRGNARSTELKDGQHAWISNYAWGDDYHLIVDEKLVELEKFIASLVPAAKTRRYVDTGPLLERTIGKNAGLGWIGKNTLLINTKIGSNFFLGEVITDLVLEFDTPDSDHCGTCTRCLDACPTLALTPYELNSNKCISYLTIEHRGVMNQELSSQLSGNVYGCDICQDVCPWNKKAPVSTDERFAPREGLFHPLIEDFEVRVENSFTQTFKNSPMKRTKKEGLLRNIDLLKQPK